MQIPDEVRKSVVFVCFKDHEQMRLAGTAFLFALPVPSIGDNASFSYLVTAKHVISCIAKRSIDAKVYLRVNHRGEKSTFIETNVSDWESHPDDDSVDVSVLPCVFPANTFDCLSIPADMAATEEVIKSEAIGVGDDVFLTGLFVNHFGQERNLPIVRTGNISLMPEEKVKTQALGPIDAYLVEARSIGGLSGSPVFIYLGPMRMVGGANRLAGGTRFFLLGLMHGHWDVIDVAAKDELSVDALSRERVNMGIAIVVPITKVLEVINQAKLADARRAEITRISQGAQSK